MLCSAMLLLRGHLLPSRSWKGFVDPEARRGDGMEFADNTRLGKIQYLVVWFTEMMNL
jgi:hypothetical protein